MVVARPSHRVSRRSQIQISHSALGVDKYGLTAPHRALASLVDLELAVSTKENLHPNADRRIYKRSNLAQVRLHIRAYRKFSAQEFFRPSPKI